MTRAEMKVIENIIAARPYLYGWQDGVEREQKRVIADLNSPAKTVVAELIKLDNMRIDLCNLKVLYEFIRQGVGEGTDRIFGVSGAASRCMYGKAKKQVELAGYTLKRAKDEFDYLFRQIKKKKRLAKIGLEAEYLYGST